MNTSFPPILPVHDDKAPFDILPEGSIGLLALGDVGVQAWRTVRAQANGQPVPTIPQPMPHNQQRVVPLAPQAKVDKRLAKRVLLIGWDAADWRVIDPLLAEGLMPNLAGLIARGVRGNIATLDPPLSPMLWTSIATGKTADKHGILGFTQPDLENGRIRPVLGRTRKVKAIWNILNQEGMRSNVIGWWPSHPAEPINGVTVSNFYHRAQAPLDKPWPLLDGAVHPPELADTLAALRVHPAELTAAHMSLFVPTMAAIEQIEDEKMKKQALQRLNGVGKIIAEAATVHAAATWVLANEPWDFTAVYYDAIDHFGHGFMRFHPPRRPFVPKLLFDLFNEVTVAGYRYHDMLLGRLLGMVGPETTVILLSDHGFHPDHLRPRGIPKEPAGPAIEHRELGIIVLAGPHIQPGERVYGASLLDVTPTLLTLFGLPVGTDMDGKPLITAFDQPPDPDYIPSWEEVPGESGEGETDKEADPWTEQAVIDQLVALGYIDPPSENQQKAIERTVRESRYYLARVHLSLRRTREALPLLEMLYADAPEQRRYGLRLAQAYHDVDQLADCRRVVEAIIAREEKRFPALDLLEGTLLLAEEKPQEAMVCLQRAEAAAPDRLDLYERLGSAYRQLEAWGAAEQAYQKALAIEPESATAHRGLAQVLLRQGQTLAAVDAALRSVEVRYFQPRGHYLLGQALTALGEYWRATEAYQVALVQAPGMEAAHLQLAELYEQHLNDGWQAQAHRAHARDLAEFRAALAAKEADGEMT